MAHCKPKDTKVAIKLSDLEKFQGNTALVSDSFLQISMQHAWTASTARESLYSPERVVRKQCCRRILRIMQYNEAPGERGMRGCIC